MASFCSFLAAFTVFMAYFISPAFPSQVHVRFSAIASAPAFLPSIAPLGSPSVSAPTLSPDITPLFPTPKGIVPSPAESSLPLFPTPKGMVPSPAEASLPTIPSSPSPPNPDDFLVPGPQMALSPSGLLPVSSSVSLASREQLNFATFLGLLLFCLMQLACK